VIGFTTVALSGVVGVVLGLIAGYFGRWVDALISRIADVQLAFPFILLAIAVVAVLGANLEHIVLVLGLAGWIVPTR